MDFAELGEREALIDPVTRYATLGQRARLFLAKHWPHIGSPFTYPVVEAEIFDELIPDGADPYITPKALHDFHKRILDTPSEKRYSLLAEPTPGADPKDPNCRVWFDAVEELTNPQIIQAVAKTARDIVPEGKWNHALDLGAGTGQLGALLLENAENVTLVDQVPELLSVAARRNGQSMNYMQGDALRLRFADASADLIASGGLVYALGRENQTTFFGEVSRVLEPGGVYLDGDQNKWRSETQNPGRLALNRFIRYAVSGPELLGDPLRGMDKPAYFAGFGLELAEFTHEDPTSEFPITVRALTKNR